MMSNNNNNLVSFYNVEIFTEGFVNPLHSSYGDVEISMVMKGILDCHDEGFLMFVNYLVFINCCSFASDLGFVSFGSDKKKYGNGCDFEECFLSLVSLNKTDIFNSSSSVVFYFSGSKDKFMKLKYYKLVNSEVMYCNYKSMSDDELSCFEKTGGFNLNSMFSLDSMFNWSVLNCFFMSWSMNSSGSEFKIFIVDDKENVYVFDFEGFFVEKYMCWVEDGNKDFFLFYVFSTKGFKNWWSFKEGGLCYDFFIPYMKLSSDEDSGEKVSFWNCGVLPTYTDLMIKGHSLSAKKISEED